MFDWFVKHKTFKFCYNKAVYDLSGFKFPKLDLTSQIKRLEQLIDEKEKEELINCEVKLGTIDFTKLEEAINSKFDEECNKLDWDNVTLDEVNRLEDDVTTALSVVKSYNPDKTNFKEAVFFEEPIEDCFAWLGKEPSDFVVPISLVEVNVKKFLKEVDFYGDTFEFLRRIKSPDGLALPIRVLCN